MSYRLFFWAILPCSRHWSFPEVHVGMSSGALEISLSSKLPPCSWEDSGQTRRVPQLSCPAPTLWFASLCAWYKPMGKCQWVKVDSLWWKYSWAMQGTYLPFQHVCITISLLKDQLDFPHSPLWGHPFSHSPWDESSHRHLGSKEGCDYLGFSTWDFWILSTLMIFKYCDFVFYLTYYKP